MKTSIILGDDTVAEIGDIVCFKSDYEQCGELVSINGTWVTLRSRSPEGFGGDYIGGQEYYNEDSQRCWSE